MSITALVVLIDGPDTDLQSRPPTPVIASEDPSDCVEQLPVMNRIARGSSDQRSEDVVVIPRGKNYLGSFATVSHSGPKNFLQRIPLVFYGSDVEPHGAVQRRVTLANVYPTVGRIFGTDLRDGVALEETLGPSADPPALLVVVVWDGVGRNVLSRWPESAPTLNRLGTAGVSYERAEAGSSPSITPATHSTLGTGVFPNEHGVTGIQYRVDEDTIDVTFKHRDPSILEVTTFGDDIDAALGNEPKVGLLGWRSWHMGMLGHGASIPGGDRDDLALIDHQGRVTGQRPYFTVPDYLRDTEGELQAHLDAADAADGERDGLWMGHELRGDQDNPGWVSYQSDLLGRMIEQGGYGADDVPDILVTNFKATDRVGHLYNMESAEMGEVLAAQDAAVGDLVDLLDEEVEDYVVVVTADHGHTPSPEVTGAWPIHQRELEDDIDAYFAVPEGETLTQAMTAVGVFVDHPLMRRMGITEDQFAAFLARYTIRQNWSGRNLPDGYEARGAETVFEAAFPAARLPEMMECGTTAREASG